MRLSVSAYLCICLPPCLSIYLSTIAANVYLYSPCLTKSSSQSIYLSIYLYVYLSMYLSVCLYLLMYLCEWCSSDFVSFQSYYVAFSFCISDSFPIIDSYVHLGHGKTYDSYVYIDHWKLTRMYI